VQADNIDVTSSGGLCQIYNRLTRVAKKAGGFVVSPAACDAKVRKKKRARSNFRSILSYIIGSTLVALRNRLFWTKFILTTAALVYRPEGNAQRSKCGKGSNAGLWWLLQR
jgi:hypothetical protein